MAIDAETGDQTDCDAQDTAEVLDEDNQNPDMVRALGDETNFDTMPDVLDVTRAAGDEDDDEALIGEDLDDADIVRLSRESNQDDADREDDDLRARDADAYADEDAEDNDLADDDRDENDKVAYLHHSEVGMRDAGDLNNTQGARSAAQRMESSRVSDEDLAKLGYARDDARTGETRSFGSERPDGDKPDLDKTDDLSAEPLPHEPHHPDREDERLDEGVEETFPASDPVSVKHIT